MAAPSMKERQACWGARDEYWKCLDENTEDASQCKKLRSTFESSCPQQWVIFGSGLRRDQDVTFRNPLFEMLLLGWKSRLLLCIRLPEILQAKIKYFDKRRDYLKFKEKFEAGQFQPSKTTAKS